MLRLQEKTSTPPRVIQLIQLIQQGDNETFLENIIAEGFSVERLTFTSDNSKLDRNLVKLVDKIFGLTQLWSRMAHLWANY